MGEERERGVGQNFWSRGEERESDMDKIEVGELRGWYMMRFSSC